MNDTSPPFAATAAELCQRFVWLRKGERGGRRAEENERKQRDWLIATPTSAAADERNADERNDKSERRQNDADEG